MIAFDAEAHIFPSSYEAMRQEAASLVNRLGWTAEDACRLVGIRTQQLPTDTPQLPFTPTPSEIAAEVAAIRSGDTIMNDKSAERWRQDREFRGWNEDADPYDLAGDIDEDACPTPSWFNG